MFSFIQCGGSHGGTADSGQLLGLCVRRMHARVSLQRWESGLGIALRWVEERMRAEEARQAKVQQFIEDARPRLRVRARRSRGRDAGGARGRGRGARDRETKREISAGRA